MSRTINTSPLTVQACHVPAWSVTEMHCCDMRGGPDTCNIDDGDHTWNRWRYLEGCIRIASYYHGVCGGSRHGQSGYARTAERADRTRVRAELLSATRIANGTRADTDTIDVRAARRDITRDLW